MPVRVQVSRVRAFQGPPVRYPPPLSGSISSGESPQPTPARSTTEARIAIHVCFLIMRENFKSGTFCLLSPKIRFRFKKSKSPRNFFPNRIGLKCRIIGWLWDSDDDLSPIRCHRRRIDAFVHFSAVRSIVAFFFVSERMSRCVCGRYSAIFAIFVEIYRQMEDFLLRVEHVSKHYSGHTALDDVSLDIPRG